MKNSKLLFILILSYALLSSCTKPLEDRYDIPVTGVQKQLDFSVTQNPNFDNELYLFSNTPGVIPFWDYGSGVTNKAIDTITIRFAGSYYIKYYGYTSEGPVIDSAQITVSQNDEKFFANKYWGLLTNGAAGKTWVWATDNTEAGGILYGVGPYSPDPSGSDNFDWQAGFGWYSTSDVQQGEITFDLNGAANFTRKLADGTVTKGFFSLDTTTYVFALQGVTMLNQEADNNTSSFRIARLNENELIFCQIYDWGGQRPYYFKRKGYSFP